MRKSLRLLALTSLLIGLLVAVVPQASYACSGGAVQVSSAFSGMPGVSADGSGPDYCLGGTGNPIYAFISIILTFATGVLGLIMVLMIVIAGLEYVVSNGDPNATKGAKDRIRNVITGFVLYVFMYGILEILLPTGSSVFK